MMRKWKAWKFYIFTIYKYLHTNVLYYVLTYYNKNRRAKITTVDSDTVKYCQMSEIYISIHQFNIYKYVEIYKIESHRKAKINALLR